MSTAAYFSLQHYVHTMPMHVTAARGAEGGIWYLLYGGSLGGSTLGEIVILFCLCSPLTPLRYLAEVELFRSQ